MAKGDGSITKVRRDVWRVRVDFGKDPITGKRQMISRNVKGTKREAAKVRDELRKEHESGLRVDADKMTFAELSTIWNDARTTSGTIASTTAYKDKFTLNTLLKYLGAVNIKEITPAVVESLYSAIKSDKEKTGSSFGGTSMRHLHVMLKQIMGKAVDYDLLLRNPCDRVRAPKADEPDRKSLTVEEAAKLLACIDEAEVDAYANMEAKEARQTARGNLFGREYLRGLNIIGNVLAIRIGLATGMRRGEVFGLCWGSIDLENRRLNVAQSLTSLGEVKPPKSKAGVRTIAIDATTCAHLRAWKQRQGVELLKVGIKLGDSTPVCCSERGGFIDLHNFERWWRAFRNENGFTDLRFHELRHTQATQLLANGIDVKTVQTRLGHSNAALTLNWYAHAIPENDEKAADMLGDLFASKPKETPIIEAGAQKLPKVISNLNEESIKIYQKPVAISCSACMQ